jgi:hypothetical protein
VARASACSALSKEVFGNASCRCCNRFCSCRARFFGSSYPWLTRLGSTLLRLWGWSVAQRALQIRRRFFPIQDHKVSAGCGLILNPQYLSAPSSLVRGESRERIP